VTPVKVGPSNSTDVRLARAHWRLRGSCQSRLRSIERRNVQIGSWCETATASWPSAARRADSSARSIRALHQRVGLSPTRAQRIPEQAPGARIAHRPFDVAPLEEVCALDQVGIGVDRKAELLGDRAGGLLRTLQRARHDVCDVVAREGRRRRLRHPVTELAQVVPR
jgi:hypothetical protein